MAKKIVSSSESEWLEHRRNYLTASEVSKCIRSPKYARDLREEKRTGERGFKGNEYTRFGSENEEIVALGAIWGEYDQLFANGDTLWVSEEHEGFAATPDLISHDMTWIGEIKTVGEHRDWGDGPIPADYYDQVQWQLLVTGAEKNVFIWQPYTRGEDGALVLTGEPRTRVIERDEARIAELIEFGNAWLSGEDQASAPDVGELLTQRLDVDRRIAELNTLKKSLTEQISEVVGDKPGSWDYPGLGTVTVTKPRVSTRFDKKTFEKEHPELVGKYDTRVEGAPSLRITAEKKEGAK